jgi:2-phosphoglycolate phosphatase, prokaryotic
VTERWPEAVVFDLDGTLIDSVGDITDALNGALAKEGLETFSEAELRLMVGGGARVLIERALKARGLSEDAGLAQRLHASFMDIYKSASVARTTVYPHGRELLSELRRDGAKLAICTNKPLSITEDVLVKLGLREFFQAVVGGTDELPKKPDPAMLREALYRVGSTPDRAVMVGDSNADVGAARAAGVPVVVVSFGYSRVPAQELGADVVIDSLAELKRALADLRKG